MFKIVRIPEILESFFKSLENQFHWNHYDYFCKLVVLTAISWGRWNISNLYRHLDSSQQPHRSRFNNFLNVQRWNPAAALQLKAQEMLEYLKLKKGDVVELILDDTKNKKRGKAMDAVGWIHDPLSGKSVRGHQYVTAVIRYHGHVIPWGIQLYVKKEHCSNLGLAFKKTTQLAAELIEAFEVPDGVQVRVLFDSYYLCPVVVKACRRKQFRFVSTLKSNRNLYRNGRTMKTGSYSHRFFRKHSKQTCHLDKTQGSVQYTYVDAGWLKVGKLGSMHVIFSRKNRDKKILGIVTDDPQLSGSRIIETYDHRWSIEVFFKDSKQLLGLGQFQNGSYQAAVTHLHLVCFAYALLTHIAILREGEKGKRKNKAKLSTADLQNEARRMVWDDLAEHLRQFSSGTQIIKELERLLIAA